MEKIQLINEIEDIILKSSSGWKNTTSINEINSKLYKISGLNVNPLDEKIASIRNWIEILYSPRKHENYGGMENVKLYILHDCYSLKEIIKSMS